MTIDELKQSGSIIFECISGSRAYGLATETSDTDIKGVFILPKAQFYSLDYVGQVNDEKNDVVYYELRKFMELLAKNNPNMLEMLNTPEDCILYKDPVFDMVSPELFLSKLCKDSFAGYANEQIRKARGLKKKIINPIDKERKTVLDFCYVTHAQGSIPVAKFLEMQGIDQKQCGLTRIPHMHEVYGLYYSKDNIYNGIVKSSKANDVALSSISKGEKPMAIMSFNKTGYSKYCKDYKEYWSWVEKRNEVRYENTIEHGKNYDAKNMMHTFRLLEMAKEIGETGSINVRRPDRDYLLLIKSGEFEYQELLEKAEAKLKEVEIAFSKSNLKEKPDLDMINALLVEIREKYYK